MTRGRMLAVVVLVLCLAVPACKKANKNVTKENLDKIKPGMTQVEVEANKFRSGERDLVDFRELSADDGVLHIYGKHQDTGWRIAEHATDPVARQKPRRARNLASSVLDRSPNRSRSCATRR